MERENHQDQENRSGLMERIFGRKGEPLLWSLAALLVLVIAAAAGVARLIGRQDLAAYAVIPAILSVITAIIHRDAMRLIRAAVLGVGIAVLAGIGIAVSGYPLAAGVAAAIIFCALTAMKAVTEWSIESDLLSLGYFLAAIIAVMGEIPYRAALNAAIVGIFGTLAGLAAALVYGAISKRREKSAATKGQLAGRPLKERLRAASDLHNAVVRFALVRGIVMGIGVGLLYSSTSDDSRSIAWVLVALFAVMRPVHRDTVSLAVFRVVTTFFAVVFIGAFSVILPDQATLALASAGLVTGILYIKRSPVPITVTGTMLAVAVAGAPSGQIGTWALARLVDTLIGGGIAVVVIFLLMPILDRAFGGTEPDTV